MSEERSSLRAIPRLLSPILVSIVQNSDPSTSVTSKTDMHYCTAAPTRHDMKNGMKHHENEPIEHDEAHFER